MSALGQTLAGTVVFGGDWAMEASAMSGGAAACVLPSSILRRAPVAGAGQAGHGCPANVRVAGAAPGFGCASGEALGVTPVVEAFWGEGVADSASPSLLRVGEAIAAKGLAAGFAMLLRSVGAGAAGEGFSGATGAGLARLALRCGALGMALADNAPGVLLHGAAVAGGTAGAQAGGVLEAAGACDSSGRSQTRSAGYPTYMGGVSVQFRPERPCPMITFSEVFP